MRAHMMKLALAEAERGRGKTRPNPMVGCVIARGDTVISVGHHVRAGAAHAEVAALGRAGAQARGADVYVTLEPCSHVGRTGPCADALIAAGVKRVFVGSRDPNPRVLGRGLRRLRAAGIRVEVGLLGAECRALNEAFAFAMTYGRPYVVAKMAQSLDGRVATATGASKWITSAGARRRGHLLRAELDAIVVGAGTVMADDPRLTCHAVRGLDPVRVVLDTHARTPVGARVVLAAQQSKAPTLICTGPRPSPQRRLALERAGALVLPCKLGPNGKLALTAVLQHLTDRSVMSVLLEGGPTALGAFFDAQLVNKVVVFMSPSILGGRQALSSVLGQGVAGLAERHWLHKLRTESVGRDLIITADVRGKRLKPRL